MMDEIIWADLPGHDPRCASQRPETPNWCDCPTLRAIDRFDSAAAGKRAAHAVIAAWQALDPAQRDAVPQELADAVRRLEMEERET